MKLALLHIFFLLNNTSGCDPDYLNSSDDLFTTTSNNKRLNQDNFEQFDEEMIALLNLVVVL